MRKLPVTEIIRQDVLYVLQNYSRLFSLIWIPAAVVQAAILGLGLIPVNLVALRTTVTIAYQLISFFLYAIAALAIVRHMNADGGTVRLTLDKAEWRLFWASIRVILYAFAGMIVLILVAVIVAIAGGVGQVPAPILTAIMVGIFGTAAVVGFVYLAVAYAFFLPMGAYRDESRLLVWSHASGKGNFWRILAVMLAVSIPLFLVGLLIVGFEMILFWDPAIFHWPASVADFGAMAAAFQKKTGVTIVAFIVGIIFRVASWSLTVGAAVLGYRALFGDQTSAAIFE
jgi:hypothetical protein